jgi:hypothetical protein
MIHDLKTWPEPFNLVLGGLKAFELRRDDRGFEVGHHLQLREWDHFARSYTGRELTRRITCIVRSAGPQVLPEGFVVLGMEDMAPMDEQARLGALLCELADILGVRPTFGAIEEQPLLDAARRLVARAGKDPRLDQVLDLIREAHGSWLLGSAPKAKECTGEAARLLAALIDGRA